MPMAAIGDLMFSAALRLLFVFFCLLHCESVHAQVESEPKRPLVLIPGILGSKLCDENGNVVWGTGRSLSNLEQLDLTPDGTGIKLQHCGLINKIEILGPLYAIKAYDKLTIFLHSIGYVEGKNLFIFDYDWRQSNYKTAADFKQFVDAKIPSDQDFNILAHSMGGIIASIYLANFSGADRVKEVIYLGTPFLGSMNTFGTLKDGWGVLENILAGGKDTIRRIVLSFPSLLELLPRYQCCYVREDNNAKTNLDVFDASTWKRLGWLPPSLVDGANFETFKANLETAKTLTPILITAPPQPLRVTFAGDAVSTRRLLGMKRDDVGPSGWLFSESRGDGTVTVWSAARNQTFDNLQGTLQSFGEHSTLFDDKWVLKILERELLEIPPVDREPIAAVGRPNVTFVEAGEVYTWPIEIVSVVPDGPTKLPNEDVSLKVFIQFQDDVRNLKANSYRPKLRLITDTGAVELTVSDISIPEDIQRNQLSFAASGNVGPAEGIVQVITEVTDDFFLTTDIEVVEHASP
jgi:pimeloyl-ACP methyl ester carboxylesterase